MKLPSKPIVCFDFDGVIHSYKSGWKGAHTIPDPPVFGSIETLLDYLTDFTVCIHTSRFNAWQEDGPAQIAVWDWLRERGEIPGDLVNVNADNFGIMDDKINLCATKPAAFLTIDDRVWLYSGGRFPSRDEVKAFESWLKRGAK